MTAIGLIILVGMAAAAMAVAGVMLGSGWRAVQDELVARNFRSDPPGVGGLLLTLVGVVVPVVMIALFLLGLAFWLVRALG